MLSSVEHEKSFITSGLIWVCTVCLCPTKKEAKLIWVKLDKCPVVACIPTTSSTVFFIKGQVCCFDSEDGTVIWYTENTR